MVLEYGSILLKDCVKPCFALPGISRGDFDCLVESIRVDGVLSPVVVNRRDGMVLYGYWVVRACGVLEGRFPGSYDCLDVVFVDLDEECAVAFGLACRRLGRELDEEDIVRVLCDLDVDDDVDLCDGGVVHDFFEGVVEEDLSEFDCLVDFDDDFVDDCLVDGVVGCEEFFLSVCCADVDELGFLFEELSGRGYRVRKHVF